MTRQNRAGMIGAARPLRAGGLGAADAGRRAEAPAAPRRAPSGTVFGDLMSDFQDAFGGFGGFGAFNPFAVAGPAAPAGSRGSFVELRFEGPTGARVYKLYRPTCVADNGTLPLVVMLHGCSQTPDDFATGTRMNDWAERDGFLVCYPAQTSAANGQRCWNWFMDGDQQRDRGEPALIAGITRDVMERHAVDADRVYVAGLSAGGALAATMGQRYPDLYAAVGVHSGLACGAAHDAHSAFGAMRSGAGAVLTPGPDRVGVVPVPAIVFHGDRDATVHPVNADEVAAQAIRSSAETVEVEDGAVPGGRAYRRTRYLDAAGRARAEQWSVHGAGHAWSGGDASGSFTDPQGPDASGEMLRFFAEHVGASLGPR